MSDEEPTNLEEAGVLAPWVFDALRELETNEGCTCTPEQEWYENHEEGDGWTSHNVGMRWKHADDCPRSQAPAHPMVDFDFGVNLDAELPQLENPS